jgi:PKD domain-containing protein
MFNNIGHGDFLLAETLSVPTRDLAKFARRQARKDAALASIYATRRGNTVNVFVLSRKMDGYPEPGDDGFTPTTIELPFKRANAVTLYAMSGDPRHHNLDEEKIKLVKTEGIPFASSFKLTRATTGAARDGLPPASALLYVFEETDIAAANRKPQVTVQAPATAVVGKPAVFKAVAQDADGDALKYAWSLGGAGAAEGAQTAFTFTKPGEYRVAVSVDDGRGGVTTKPAFVEVGVAVGGVTWGYRDFNSKAPQTPGLTAEPDGRLGLHCHGRYVDAQIGFDLKPLAGDGSVQIRLDAIENAGRAACAGLTLRDDLREWKLYRSRHASLLFLADRKTPNAGKVVLSSGRKEREGPSAAVKLPCWLRLERKGDTFTGYVSPTGKDGSWKKVGETQRAMQSRLWPAVAGYPDARTPGKALFGAYSRTP